MVVVVFPAVVVDVEVLVVVIGVVVVDVVVDVEVLVVVVGVDVVDVVVVVDELDGVPNTISKKISSFRWLRLCETSSSHRYK